MTNLDLDKLEAHLRYPFNPGLPLELQRELIAELREARSEIETKKRTTGTLITKLQEARATIVRVRALAYSFAVGADGEERILEALDGA